MGQIVFAIGQKLKDTNMYSSRKIGREEATSATSTMKSRPEKATVMSLVENEDVQKMKVSPAVKT